MSEEANERGERSDWFQAPWVCYSTFIAVSALVLLIFILVASLGGRWLATRSRAKMLGR